MTRFPDWQSRLANFLASRQRAPFAWGLNDCGTFMGSAVEAETGVDPARGLRAHRTAQGALGVIRRGKGLGELASRRVGPEIAPALAQVGDVGLATLEGRETLLVYVGGGWVGPGADGLVRLPRNAATRAWKVG